MGLSSLHLLLVVYFLPSFHVYFVSCLLSSFLPSRFHPSSSPPRQTHPSQSHNPIHNHITIKPITTNSPFTIHQRTLNSFIMVWILLCLLAYFISTHASHAPPLPQQSVNRLNHQRHLPIRRSTRSLQPPTARRHLPAKPVHSLTQPIMEKKI